MSRRSMKAEFETLMREGEEVSRRMDEALAFGRSRRKEKLRHDGYPKDWRLIATQKKIEAGWRCERCGHPAESPFERKPCDGECDLRRHIEFRDYPDYADFIRSFILTQREPPLWPTQKQRVLTVHHLNGEKADCRWWNLTALCQVCHLKFQNRLNLNQAYMFEHSDWFKPYVAGWYAWIYLRQELKREEVEAHLDALLALEPEEMAFEVGKP